MKKYELSLQVGLIRYSDIGKEMTLRNANEHRRLEGRLKHLDLQLHNKMVSMQSEILELRSSQCLKGTKKSPGSLVGRERACSDIGLRSPRAGRKSGQLQDRQAAKSCVFPEINLQHNSLVSDAGHSTHNKFANNRDASPFGKRFLPLPSSPSLYARSSLPDLRVVESIGHSPPRTDRVFQTSPKPDAVRGEQNSTTTFPTTQKDLEDRMVNNNTMTRSAEKITGYEAETGLRVAVPEIGKSPDNRDAKSKSSEKPDSIYLNSVLMKATFGERDSQSAQHLASMGFVDFNTVIDKRLKQTQDELPTQEQMRQVRYLRWRDEEEEELDIVKAVPFN